jgi:signal transduction histidine kinase
MNRSVGKPERGRRIVIVDGRDLLGGDLEQLLGAAGHRACFLGGGRDAAGHLRQAPPVDLPEVVVVVEPFSGAATLAAIERGIAAPTSPPPGDDRVSASEATRIAHEINNPLTYLMMNLHCAADALRAASAGGDPALLGELAGMLEDAHEGATRIRDVVRSLWKLHPGGVPGAQENEPD